MLDRWGGFGTFLFFGLINLTFIPFIYIFYPETKGRSLEEIDVMFAKGYCTGEWYVKVADEMPRLTAGEIEEEAKRWGLAEGDAVGCVRRSIADVLLEYSCLTSVRRT